jgi:hypothetical protein
MSDTEYIRLLEEQVKDYQRLVALFKEALSLKDALIESMKAEMQWRAEQ